MLTLWDSAAYLFPRCSGTIEAGDDDPSSSYVETLTLDQQHGAVFLHLATTTDLTGQVVSARMVRVGTDTERRRCECGSVRLRDAGVSAAGGDVRRLANGAYRYVDRRWGPASEDFRLVDRPGRHFQRDRALGRRHLPALVALCALAALGLVAVHTRRAMTYAGFRFWTEARLDASGRVESESGELLGIINSPGRALDAGAVLIAPEAGAGTSLYRDVPNLARRHIALGSHARWQEGTLRAVRSARGLAVISVLCSTAALAGRLLGS